MVKRQNEVSFKGGGKFRRTLATLQGKKTTHFLNCTDHQSGGIQGQKKNE